MNELERIVQTKIKPLIDDAMHKNLGITVTELESDISDRIKHGILDFVDTSILFKQAKRQFKHQYIARLLQLHTGNVEDVAKAAGVDRRSIHRFVAQMRLEVKKLRESPIRNYVKEAAVQSIIQGALENYRSALNPIKYQAMYAQAPQLSKNIVDSLPEVPKTLAQAEAEFEKQYLQKALKENNNNISKTARKIGLRFETLHRKLKSLGIKK